MKYQEYSKDALEKIIRSTLDLDSMNNILHYNVIMPYAATVVGKIVYNWSQKPRRGDKLSAADIIQQSVLYKKKYEYCALEDIIKNISLIPELLNLRFSGPWIERPGYNRLFKEITSNINLITLTNVLALDNLGSTFYPGTITFFNSFTEVAHSDYSGNIVVDVHPYDMKGILAHEMAHRGMMILNNYLSAAPYKNLPFLDNKKEKDNFENVMMQSLRNLHHELIPDKPVPEELKQITSNIYSIMPQLNFKEGEMTGVFINMFRQQNVYQIDDYHNEFVVRLPEAIARFGDIPPYLIDCYKPLTDFYKTSITPKWMSYIEDHSYRENLIPTDIDKYHPETYLSRSGEDELLAKAATNTLNSNETALVNQIKQIEHFLKNKDTQTAISYLSNITDERIIRFTLSQAIESNNKVLFDAAFSKIQAPQYLGPQLVKATEKNLPEMALALMPAVENKYYLTKALEISLIKEIPEIFYPSYARVNDNEWDEWFLKNVRLNSADKTLVKTAIALNQDFTTAISYSRSMLEAAKDQHIQEQISSGATCTFPQAQIDDLINSDPSLLAGLKTIEQPSPTTNPTSIIASIAIDAATAVTKTVYNYFYPPKTLSEKEKQWFMLIGKKDNIENIKEFLVQNKDFDPNTRNLDGKTALHLLVEKNRKKIMRFLIEKGADVNIQDKNGNTPLHFAVQKEYPNLVKFLISNNARIDIINKSNHKVSDLAKSDFMQILLTSQNILNEKTAKTKPYEESLPVPMIKENQRAM